MAVTTAPFIIKQFPVDLKKQLKKRAATHGEPLAQYVILLLREAMLQEELEFIARTKEQST